MQACTSSDLKIIVGFVFLIRKMVALSLFFIGAFVDALPWSAKPMVDSFMLDVPLLQMSPIHPSPLENAIEALHKMTGAVSVRILESGEEALGFQGQFAPKKRFDEITRSWVQSAMHLQTSLNYRQYFGSTWRSPLLHNKVIMTGVVFNFSSLWPEECALVGHLRSATSDFILQLNSPQREVLMCSGNPLTLDSVQMRLTKKCFVLPLSLHYFLDRWHFDYGFITDLFLRDRITSDVKCGLWVQFSSMIELFWECSPLRKNFKNILSLDGLILRLRCNALMPFWQKNFRTGAACRKINLRKECYCMQIAPLREIRPPCSENLFMQTNPTQPMKDKD